MMSISSLNEPLKDVIRSIVWCSGEPLAVSSEVVELFFNHLRSCCTSIANRLPNNQPSLRDLLNAVRYDTLKLTRIFDYFRILKYNEDDFIEVDSDLVSHVNNGPDVSRVSALCTQLGIPLPVTITSTTPKLRTAFLQGRRLRLARIDQKFARLSVKDYITFTRVRQSATLLVFIRNNQRLAFWHWVFLESKYPPEFALDDCIDLNSHNLLARPEVREFIRVLAHLLTGEILDVVDLTLFYRRKLGIDLQTPITPVEVNQTLRLMSKHFPLKTS
ncbi:hypothetical protein EG68_08872 [Paragonimus skrjabini miyazakii]|uniref:Uncharacterized protein n=1 Tax=Paragonimus skrjabini miyazakii TaxID=59628 RepID=A0A8S9YN47_9TREM|nr:hypothetical protein EG68_08872 [Paragonimus skrjabini miyazakii]